MGGPRLVQWSRFSDAWSKLFGLQGNTQLNVVDDCFITLPAEEELEHLAYLRGWKSFAVWLQPGAVAGQVSNVGLVPASGTLAVIQGFSVFSAAGATSFKVGFPIAARGPGTAVPGRDSRLVAPTLPVRVPAVSVNAGSGGASIVPTVALSLQAGTYAIPFVVAAGAEWAIENNTVNQAFDVNVWGKYRELTQQEV